MTTSSVRRRDPGGRLFLAAAAVGLPHALPSLYWPLGGSALLSTVGARAQTYRDESPGQATALLLVVVVVKVAGAVVPLLNHQQRLPLPRLFVYPVVQGRGRGLFPEGAQVPPLRRLEARPFDSGIVLLRFAPTGRG